MASPTPSDRTERFSLRLHPDEMAAVEDLQDRQGGPSMISMNSVIASMITEAYYYRTVAPATPSLPLSHLSLARVQWTADELGCTLASALDTLITRGMPHHPGTPCDHQAPGVPAKTPPSDLLTRYATPRPSGLPPVRPVPGQDGIDLQGESA